MLAHTRNMRCTTGSPAPFSRPVCCPQRHLRCSPGSRMVTPYHRTAVRMAAVTAASSQNLQQLLAQKEQQLASLFESGRPMPQASLVAALRSEIAALDDQLHGRPSSGPILTPPAPTNTGYTNGGGGGYRASTGGGSSSGALTMGQVGASGPGGPPSRGVRSRTEQLADRAYEMVQQQMQSNQGQVDDAEVARMEHENQQLRAEAYALLQRQQQLETMLAEARGQKEPELLLESAEGLLARMKAKLQKA